jgi:HEAT repeat protein
MVAAFSTTLYLLIAGPVREDMEAARALEEHEKFQQELAREREAASREAVERGDEKLAELKKRIEDKLEKAEAKLNELIAKNEELLKAERGGETPDPETVSLLAKLPVAELAGKLRSAIESGDSASASLIAAAMRENADKALDYLLKGAGEAKDATDRFYVLYMLSMLHDRRTLEFFLDILRTAKDDLALRVAAGALTTVGDESCVPALIDAMLASRDWGVRTNCAAALGIIGDARAVASLESVFKEDVNPVVRNYALAALARIADPGSVEFLADVARTSDDEDHLLIAVRGLLAIGTVEAAAALEKIAEQPGGTGEEARAALEELRQAKDEPEQERPSEK